MNEFDSRQLPFTLPRFMGQFRIRYGQVFAPS